MTGLAQRAGLPSPAPAPAPGTRPNEGIAMLQLLTDLLTTGALDAFSSIIDIIHWED